MPSTTAALDLQLGGEKARPSQRRPLARTFSLARWSEYREVLLTALAGGYRFLSLEQWLAADGPQDQIVILRHDVDQHPACVLPMLEIESEVGVRATWYFRWRTASAPVIAAVREQGGDVGLHYETLTRLVLERRLGADGADAALIAEARELLCEEVAAFAGAFGTLRSIAPHGDTRVPGVSNRLLVEDHLRVRDVSVLDGNATLDRHRLGLWLTDRSAADGRWMEGIDPARVFAAGIAPVLLLTHPNNWCSGASLWRDRLRAAALPSPQPGAATRPWLGVRTAGDAPPRPSPPPEAPIPRVGRQVDFAMIALSLRREVLRLNYDRGLRMTSSAAINTLITNADLAESRASMLERALSEAGVPSVRGLDVLDLGCGFGALALVFAAHGARVTALDPNDERMQVGATVARHHGLEVQWVVGAMQDARLPARGFDVVVMNNSLCYVVNRRARRAALEHAHRVLRPGGAIVLRNPNRLHPRDQFTGLPLLGTLPPRLANGVAWVLRRHRSRVRMLSGRAARRELRRAGFVLVRSVRRPHEGRLRAMVAGYQHLVARVAGAPR